MEGSGAEAMGGAGPGIVEGDAEAGADVGSPFGGREAELEGLLGPGLEAEVSGAG